MTDFPELPDELTRISHWSVHRNKVPKSVDGKLLRLPLAEAKKLLNNGNTGLSFDFKDTPYAYSDLDSYKDIADKALHQELIDIACADTYVEVSMSGKGHHIVYKGEQYASVKGIDNKGKNLLFMTGNSIGCPDVGTLSKGFITASGFKPISTGKQDGTYKQTDIAGHIRAVLAAENYNDSLCSLSASFASNGLNHKQIVQTLHGILDACPHKDKRWRDRKKHVTVHASTALKKFASTGASDRGDHTEQPSLNLIPATEIKPEPIIWLWPGYLAKGKLHIFAGPAGTGKTTIALSNASTISAGKKFPDGAQASVGKVLIWSGEDDPQDTLLPRLLGMGANPQNIFFIGDIRQGDEIKSFDPSVHMGALAVAIDQIGSVAVLIIDPIVNAVAGDSHKNTEVRRALQPVVDLAANKGIAVIGITHFSKSTAGRNPVERVTGSIAFGALARVVLAAVKIEDSDGEEKRLFTRAKSNIGPDGGGFYYSIGQEWLVNHPEIQASSITCHDPIEGDARTLLSQAETVTDSEEKGALSEAQIWLEDLLIDVVEMEKTEIMALAKQNNFSSRTVQRAREKLKVKYRTEGFGKDKKSLWSLPDTIRANSGIHAKKTDLGTNGETADSGGIEGDSSVMCANDMCTGKVGTNGTNGEQNVCQEGEI